jgi:hypothetical protein
MMGIGNLILAAVFCLLGTIVLAALAFAGFRYFVETGRNGDDKPSAVSPPGAMADRVDR